MPKSEASGNNRTVRIPPERQRRVKPDRTTESDPAAGMEGPSSHPDDLLQSDFSQRTFERHAALLADPRLSSLLPLENGHHMKLFFFLFLPLGGIRT